VNLWHRKVAGMGALFKAYTGEMACEAIGDRLQAPSYLYRVDQNCELRNRKQRTDVGKYTYVNRTFTD
jgi:hypothetical protein